MHIKGNDIVAESNIPLQTGSIYSMKVHATFPLISFKIIQKGAPLTSEQQAIQILNQLNIQVSNVTRAIVQQLTSLDLPVTQNSIATIMAHLTQWKRKNFIKSLNRNQIRIFLLLYQKNIPINSKTFAIVKDYLENKNPADNSIFEMIRNILADLNENTPPDSAIFRKFFKYLKPKANANELTKAIKNAVHISGSSIQDVLTPVLLNYIYKLTETTQFSRLLHLLFEMLAHLQNVRILNSHPDDVKTVYYFPLTMTIDSNPLILEFFYQKLTLYSENDDKIPGFYINLFITIQNSPPLHIELTKKIPRMLSIQFHHPFNGNLELLRSHSGELKRMVRMLGYRTVRITYTVADTDDPGYKSKLFFPKKHIVKTVNITG